MYKTILVGVDGSDMANLALYEAINLAHVLKSKLYIAHVINISLPVSADVGYISLDLQQYQADQREQGQNILNKAKVIADSVGVNVSLQLIENSAGQRVSEVINHSLINLKADLLVLGTHGLSGFRLFFLGSVADEVIRTTTKPILLVRADATNH